jgi:hypothetical protein
MKYYCIEPATKDKPGVCVLPTMQEPRGGHLGELVKYLKHIDSLEKFDTSCDRAGWFEALTQFQECQNGKWVNVQIRDTVNAYRWFIVPKSEEKDGIVAFLDKKLGEADLDTKQSAFKFDNGVRIIVYTGVFPSLLTEGLHGQYIRSFKCDENWQPEPKPFAECPLSWNGKTATEYHLHLRNFVHKPEDFVAEQSTTLPASEEKDLAPEEKDDVLDVADYAADNLPTSIKESSDPVAKLSFITGFIKGFRYAKSKVEPQPAPKEEDDIEISIRLSQTTDKPFFINTVRDMLGKFDNKEISFSRFVEMLNITAYKWSKNK